MQMETREERLVQGLLWLHNTHVGCMLLPEELSTVLKLPPCTVPYTVNSFQASKLFLQEVFVHVADHLYTNIPQWLPEQEMTLGGAISM